MLSLMLSITFDIFLPARFIVDNAALGIGIALGAVFTYGFPCTQAERAKNRRGSDSLLRLRIWVEGEIQCLAALPIA